MGKEWRNSTGKIGRIRSISSTDATKSFGGGENQAVRYSMDGEFGIFGRAEIQVFESLESGLGLQCE
jgi:hypothetical protein